MGSGLLEITQSSLSGMKNYTILIFLLLSFLTWTSSIQAQGFVPKTQSFSVELSPLFPTPLAEVRAKIISFTFDIDRAFIQWAVNQRVIAQGIGVKEVSFMVGPLGSMTTLKVSLSPQDGTSIEKELEIRPTAIDMLVESPSFTPQWYKGAGLVTPYAGVKVVAIPHFIFEGSRLDPETLIYNWKINDGVRGDLSGRGKQSIGFKAPLIASGRMKVSVRISSPKRTLQSEAQTFIEFKKPELVFYQRRSLEGLITSQALSLKSAAKGLEMEIEAVPFFMNFSALADLKFTWSLDGKNLIRTDSKESNVLIIKLNDDTSTTTVVRLIVGNMKNILENISASFKIIRVDRINR